MANYPITIFYTQFNNQLSNFQYNDFLNILPFDQRKRNQRFVRWQDRHLHLFGRLLLIEGLKQFGFGNNEIDKLEYNKNERPFLKNSEIDFNISHSGNYAICAISGKTKVGMDIEEIKPVEFADFKRIFTKREWAEIDNSNDPLMKFYTFWTRKESIIKADGRGLSIPLDSIDVVEDYVMYDNQVWYLTELAINANYKACLASNMPNMSSRIIEIDFKSELK